MDIARLDTLGKLDARGHGLNGYCRGYRRHFGVPMPAIIAARGADSHVVRMRPVTRLFCFVEKDLPLDSAVARIVASGKMIATELAVQDRVASPAALHRPVSDNGAGDF